MVQRFNESVEELVGNTPLLKLSQLLDKKAASIFAKLDYCNPGHSVKDRIALNMIRDGEKRGLLKKGGTIIEPTSGNTGVSLALIGRQLGYDVVIVLPDADNQPLRDLILKLGAKLELTPADGGLRKAKEKTLELCKRDDSYFYPDQFGNPANPEIHRNTTAREIVKAIGGKSIDAFVAAVGTGGTITGVGEVLKAKYPNIKIVAVEPAESPVLSGGKPGMHFISGIGAGFIPPILNKDIIDSVETVSSEQAQKSAGDIVRDEQLFAGVSSGAVYHVAKKVASNMKKNQTVVAFFADAMLGVN